MFEIGDRVMLNDVAHATLTVVKTERNNVLLESRKGDRFWLPCECLHKAPKREVEITIKVEISDGVKYVAVDSTGEIYEYLGDCEECFTRFSSEKKAYRLNVTNWKQTKTKVGD